MVNRKSWEQVICKVCAELENEGIVYHVDASSSLYVHGLDFDMDDLDITVKWGQITRAHSVFKRFNPTPVQDGMPASFQFEVDDKKVDIMSYESASGIGPESERVQVAVNGNSLWSKTPQFYIKHMAPEHRLWPKVNVFFKL